MCEGEEGDTWYDDYEDISADKYKKSGRSFTAPKKVKGGTNDLTPLEWAHGDKDREELAKQSPSIYKCLENIHGIALMRANYDKKLALANGDSPTEAEEVHE